MGWILGLVIVVLGVIATVVRRQHISRDANAGIDTATVSESWLAEQRGHKDDRQLH